MVVAASHLGEYGAYGRIPNQRVEESNQVATAP